MAWRKLPRHHPDDYIEIGPEFLEIFQALKGPQGMVFPNYFKSKHTLLRKKNVHNNRKCTWKDSST